MDGYFRDKTTIKVMLNRANKICFVLFLAFFSCQDEGQELKLKREQFYQYTLQLVGSKEYFSIYQALNDSVDNWIKNGLGYYKHLGKTKNYQIDSLVSLKIC